MNLKKLLVTFSHSLFWQISCFLLVVTAFAFGALFLVLQISEDSTGKGSAINVSGSLRMQSYVLALTVARSSEDTEVVRSKDIKAAIAEFERRLNLPGLTQAIPEESGNELRKSYDLISSDFYSKIKPMAIETIQQPQKIHEFLNTVPKFVSVIDTFVFDLVFVGVIFVLVVIHAILALRKFPNNYKAFRIMRGHYKLLRHTDTTMWWVQFITGVILTALVFPHMLPMLMDPGSIGPYGSGLEVYHSWLWVVFLFLIVTELHGMIGLYRLCMKWCGPSNATRSFLRKLTYVLIVGMIAMGSFTIMGFYNAGEEAAKLDPEAHYVPGWLQTPQTAPYPSWWPDHLKKN